MNIQNGIEEFQRSNDEIFILHYPPPQNNFAATAKVFTTKTIGIAYLQAISL